MPIDFWYGLGFREPYHETPNVGRPKRDRAKNKAQRKARRRHR